MKQTLSHILAIILLLGAAYLVQRFDESSHAKEPVSASKSYIAPEIYEQFKDRIPAKSIRHILVGEPNNIRSGGHRYGIGRPGKSEFPQSWSDKDIFDNVLSVVDDPASKRTQQGRRQVIEGQRHGIMIRVIIGDRGDIITAYPTNVKRNPR